jgi:hypothetical protein
LQGLYDEVRSGRLRTVTDEAVATLISKTLARKPKAATHWSVRSMAAETGLSKSTVHRLFPPPDKALVFCVDEKSQVQALERTQPMLPTRFGSVEGVTDDYQRHGTTTLFAALNLLDGSVLAQGKPRHRHQEYLAFLRHIEARPRQGSTSTSWSTTAPLTSTKGQSLARAAAALAGPLHAHLRLLAQPSRTLLRPDHKPRNTAGIIHIGQRSCQQHRRLHQKLQRQLQALRLDGHRRPNPRQAPPTLSAYFRDGTLARRFRNPGY